MSKAHAEETNSNQGSPPPPPPPVRSAPKMADFGEVFSFRSHECPATGRTAHGADPRDLIEKLLQRGESGEDRRLPTPQAMGQSRCHFRAHIITERADNLLDTQKYLFFAQSCKFAELVLLSSEAKMLPHHISIICTRPLGRIDNVALKRSALFTVE